MSAETRDPLELTTEAELERYFADAVSVTPEFLFRGLACTIERVGMSGIAFSAGFLMGGVAGGLMAAGTLKQPHGVYAKLWFPRSLAVDLHVRSLDHRRPENAGLREVYDVEAISPAMADRYLKGALVEVLVELRARYHVQMDDEAIEFGPLDAAPAVCASDLCRVGEAVDELFAEIGSAASGEAAQGAQVAEEVEPDAEAEFCFHCGSDVEAGCTQCPECGGSLSD